MTHYLLMKKHISFIWVYVHAMTTNECDGGLPIRLSFCLMAGLANPSLILSQTGTQEKCSSCSFNTGWRPQPLLPYATMATMLPSWWRTKNWVLVPVSHLLIMYLWKGYVLLFLHSKEKKITQERSTCWCLLQSEHPSPSSGLLPVLEWLIRRIILVLEITKKALLLIT